MLASACSQSANTNAPAGMANTSATTTAATTANPSPAQIVHASADAVTLKAGAAAEAQVRLQIADGYHVNANPATFSYLKATELEVASAEGLTAGKPAYPAAVTKKFQFAPQPLAVYERAATIRLPLRAAVNAAQGLHSLHARVNVQACDEEKCFPPTTVETDIPVTIN
jgi:uncharacterized protein